MTLEVLKFEHANPMWKYQGAKEQAIRDAFTAKNAKGEDRSMSYTRYAQHLNNALNDPKYSNIEGGKYAPTLKRLNSLMESRKQQRSARNTEE